MSRKIIVPPDCTTQQALGIVARNPSLWPRFGAFFARFGVRRARLCLACWRAGYRVATVRKMVREAR